MVDTKTPSVIDWIPSTGPLENSADPQMVLGFAPIPIERGQMTTRPSKRYPNQPLTAKNRSLRHDTMESRFGSASYRPRPLRINSPSTASSPPKPQYQAYHPPNSPLPSSRPSQSRRKYQQYRPLYHPHPTSSSTSSIPSPPPPPPLQPLSKTPNPDEPASDMIRAIDRVLSCTSTIINGSSHAPSSHARNRSTSIQVAHSNTPLMSPVIGVIGVDAERLAAPLPPLPAGHKRSQSVGVAGERYGAGRESGGVWERRDGGRNVVPLKIDTSTAQARKKPSGNFVFLQPSKLGLSHFGSGNPVRNQEVERPNISDEVSKKEEEMSFRPLDQAPLHRLPSQKLVPRPAQEEERHQRPCTAPETVSIPSRISNVFPEASYLPPTRPTPEALQLPAINVPAIDIDSPDSGITNNFRYDNFTYSLPNTHFLTRTNTVTSNYSTNSDASSSYEDFLPGDIGSIYSLDINRDTIIPPPLRITNYDDCVDDLYTVLEDFDLNSDGDFSCTNIQKALLTKSNTLASRHSTRTRRGLSRTPTTRSRLERTNSTASRNACVIRPVPTIDAVELTQWDVDSNKEVTCGPISTTEKELVPTPVFSCRIDTVGEDPFPEFWVDEVAEGSDDSNPPTPDLEVSTSGSAMGVRGWVPEAWLCSRSSSPVSTVQGSIGGWSGAPRGLPVTIVTGDGMRREWVGTKVGNLAIPESPTLSIVPDRHFTVRSLTPDRLIGKKKHKLLGLKKRWRSK